MKIVTYQTFSGDGFSYELELSDLDYLKDEFIIISSLTGFDLESRDNPKLSIHIGTYEIKYDKDISNLGLMIATERVYCKQNLLKCYSKEINFKEFLPQTSEQLKRLVDEFKYIGLNGVKSDEIKSFLVNN